MSDPRRILIIDFLAMGDLLLITPLLRTLRRRYREARVACAINSHLTDVLKHNPNVDEVIGFDREKTHAGIRGYLGFIRKLRAWKPDLVIGLQDNPRISLLVALSAARYRVGFAKHIRRLAYTHPLDANKKQHAVEYYLDVARALGIEEIENKGLELWFEETDSTYVDEMLRANNISPDASLVALSIGGSWPTKVWPAERFAELADTLNESGQTIVLVGGPGDLVSARKILNKSSCFILNAVGKTTITQLAALLSRCALVISNDTGPMHVAVSQGVPVIGIFGPSDERRYAPYEEKSKVIRTGIGCRPCGRKECPLGHWKCILDVTVSMVATDALALLKEKGIHK